jgi:hypothetical protein
MKLEIFNNKGFTQHLVHASMHLSISVIRTVDINATNFLSTEYD